MFIFRVYLLECDHEQLGGATFWMERRTRNACSRSTSSTIPAKWSLDQISSDHVGSCGPCASFSDTFHPSPSTWGMPQAYIMSLYVSIWPISSLDALSPKSVAQSSEGTKSRAWWPSMSVRDTPCTWRFASWTARLLRRRQLPGCGWCELPGLHSLFLR